MWNRQEEIGIVLLEAPKHGFSQLKKFPKRQTKMQIAGGQLQPIPGLKETWSRQRKNDKERAMMQGSFIFYHPEM